jgi:benzylsuccinate CoA-transferase BbsF subunit
LGLGYQTLRRINPTLVFASITGAGGTGPESSYPGYAPAFNALSGLGHLTGYPDGPPAELHDSIDCRVGATAAFSILSGLFHRLRTGEGQFIDISSRESIAMFTGEALMDFAMNGAIAHRQGNQHPVMAPHGCYPCKGRDAWVTIAVSTDAEWEAFCQAADHLEWSADPRFKDRSLRHQNGEALDSLIQIWTQAKTPDEAAQLLQSASVAASPSMNGEALASDPHLIAREAWREVEHPVLGRQKVQGPPWVLSETPATIRSASPLLGQHNQYVLQGLLGASTKELTAWVDDGIVL